MPSVYRSRASAVCDSVTLTVPSKSVPPGGRQKAYSAPAAAGSAPALLTPQLPAKAARWSKAPQATVVQIIFWCGGQVQSSGRSIPQEAARAVKQASQTTAA